MLVQLRVDCLWVRRFRLKTDGHILTVALIGVRWRVGRISREHHTVCATM